MEGSLDGAVVGLADLAQHVPDFVRPAALQRDARIDGRQGSDEAPATVGTDHLQAVAGEPAAVEVGKEALPRGGALAGREVEVDDLLLAVRPDTQRHQDGAFQRAGAGPARQHHAVEHERLVAVGKRARMEGGDGFIQGLGNAAHGRGRDLAAEPGQQDLAHLAG